MHKYADMYNIPPDDIHLTRTATKLIHPTNRSPNVQFFTMPDDIPVIYVSDSEALTMCAEKLLGEAVVALDAEWKPYSGGDAVSPVALLQLASPTGVWLVDLLEIRSQLPDVGTALRLLWQALQTVNVVGFGLKGDLTRLRDSFPDQINQFERAIELHTLIEAPQLSLDMVCRALLGCAIDKRMQTSDWSIRPLSEQQLHYAAADAYVLLLLLSSLSSEDYDPDLVSSRQDLIITPQQLASTTDRMVIAAKRWARQIGVDESSPTRSLPPLGRHHVETALLKMGLESTLSEICMTSQCNAADDVAVKTLAIAHREKVVVCVLLSCVPGRRLLELDLLVTDHLAPDPRSGQPTLSAGATHREREAPFGVGVLERNHHKEGLVGGLLLKLELHCDLLPSDVLGQATDQLALHPPAA